MQARQQREAEETEAGRDAPAGAGLPAHQTVYLALRARILFGELAPGAAVTIQGIAEDLGAGLTPVREALRRLTAAGALQLQGNRRVSVPVLDAAALDEIEHLRLAVEPELARRAAARATMRDVARLRATDDALDAALAAGDVAGYLAHNHAFHDGVNALAEAPILSDVAEGLWLRFGPSMRVICAAQGVAVSGLPDLHKDALAALAQRDGPAAAAALAADVAQGMAQLRAAL